MNFSKKFKKSMLSLCIASSLFIAPCIHSTSFLQRCYNDLWSGNVVGLGSSLYSRYLLGKSLFCFTKSAYNEIQHQRKNTKNFEDRFSRNSRLISLIFLHLAQTIIANSIVSLVSKKASTISSLLAIPVSIACSWFINNRLTSLRDRIYPLDATEKNVYSSNVGVFSSLLSMNIL